MQQNCQVATLPQHWGIKRSLDLIVGPVKGRRRTAMGGKRGREEKDVCLLALPVLDN